jgi:hypothetical protein
MVDEVVRALIETRALMMTAGHEVLLVLHVPLPVQLAEGGALVGVGDDQPTPPLYVARRRSLGRQPQALDDDLRLDRAIEVQTQPHRAGGGEELVGDGRVERR